MDNRYFAVNPKYKGVYSQFLRLSNALSQVYSDDFILINGKYLMESYINQGERLNHQRALTLISSRVILRNPSKGASADEISAAENFISDNNIFTCNYSDKGVFVGKFNTFAQELVTEEIQLRQGLDLTIVVSKNQEIIGVIINDVVRHPERELVVV